MNYRELKEKLLGLSEEQLAAPVVIVEAIEDQESSERKFKVVEGDASLQISSYGLMPTSQGLVEDYLGCMEDEELSVLGGAPYIQIGSGIIPDNNVYGR